MEKVKVNNDELQQLIQQNREMKQDISALLEAFADMGDLMKGGVMGLPRIINDFMTTPDKFSKITNSITSLIEKYGNH